MIEKEIIFTEEELEALKEADQVLMYVWMRATWGLKNHGIDKDILRAKELLDIVIGE